MFKNIKIERSYSGTWLVKADSQRFGEDAIMFESFRYKEASTYARKLKSGVYC
jgi:hypothetical protein